MQKAAALDILALKKPMTDLSVKELKALVHQRSRVSQTLNLKFGLAGTIITDLIQYNMKEEGVNDNIKKRYTEGKIL